MVYSPLIDETIPPSTQKWSARPAGVQINGLNVHHHATTGTGGITRLTTSSDPASANYIIRTNGNLIGSVPEQYRAWTTSSYAADDDKITVEIQNSTGSPTWEISDAAMNTLKRLYADIARRYGFRADRSHIFGHRDYYATACPGPYVYPRLDEVASAALAINNAGGSGFLADLTDEEQHEMLVTSRQTEIVVRRHEADDEARRTAQRAHEQASAQRENDTITKVDRLEDKVDALTATLAAIKAKVDTL